MRFPIGKRTHGTPERHTHTELVWETFAVIAKVSQICLRSASRLTVLGSTYPISYWKTDAWEARAACSDRIGLGIGLGNFPGDYQNFTNLPSGVARLDLCDFVLETGHMGSPSGHALQTFIGVFVWVSWLAGWLVRARPVRLPVLMPEEVTGRCKCHVVTLHLEPKCVK